MPAHKDLLDDGKIHMLTAYVWGLSNAQLAARTVNAPVILEDRETRPTAVISRGGTVRAG